MIRYQIRICDDAGITQAIPRDFRSCRYTLRADGEIGACELVLPRTKYEDLANSSNPDYRIQIWRSINGGNYRLDGHTEYFALQWNTTDDAITITAPSIQHLMTRRINAFYAGYQDFVTRVGAIYSGPVTTIMYDVINANFGIGMTDPNRDVIGILTPTLAINGPTALGPSLNIAATRENVFDIMKKLMDASWQQGRWSVGLISSNGETWNFDAYVDFAGVDRRSSLILSPEAKNIQNAVLNINSIDEKSAIIGAGRGTGQARFIRIAQSAAVIAKSLYGYKEGFVENTNARNNQIINTARAELRKKRTTVEFTCDLTQTQGTIRGIHYDIGDYLRVRYLGKRYDMRLDVVEISLDANNSVETARLTSE